jgi:glycopeptide antibiotics resistance protein
MAWMDFFTIHAGIGCILIVAGYLIAGFWPFNFVAHNRAQWSREGSGLHFKPLAIVKSKGDVNLGTAAPRAGGDPVLQFSIEMLLSSGVEANEYIRSILSIYSGAIPENLMAGQWKNAFLIRIPIMDSQGRRKYREINLDNALPLGKRRFLAIASGPSGIALYIEGRLAKTYPRIVLRPGSLHGSLIVGSTPNSGLSFTGRFFGLALFDRMLTPQEIDRHGRLWESGHAAALATEPKLAGLYLFDRGQENSVADLSPFNRALEIPEYFRSIHKRVLIPPWEDWINSPAYYEDIVINILGFIPFGFFYFIWRRGTGRGRAYSAAEAIFLSAIISAAIEITQVFLPTRTSEMLDLINNMLGGAIGVLLAAVTKAARFSQTSNVQ